MTTLHAPYTRVILLLLCGVVLLAIAVFLWWSSREGKQDLSGLTTRATPVTAMDLKKDFGSSLDSVQMGKRDTAWIKEHFLILDVRSTAEYQAGHIKGALSSPAAHIGSNMFGSDDTLVIYSSNLQEISLATRALEHMNVKQIYALTESLESLKQQGFEIEKVETYE